MSYQNGLALKWRSVTYEQMLAWAMARKVAPDQDALSATPCDNGTLFTDGSAISCGLESSGYCESCYSESFECYIGEALATDGAK